MQAAMQISQQAERKTDQLNYLKEIIIYLYFLSSSET